MNNLPSRYLIAGRPNGFVHLGFHFNGIVLPQLREQIKKVVEEAAEDWLKYGADAWIIWTKYTPDEIYNKLKDIPGMTPHSIFLFKVANFSYTSMSGQFPQWIWNWFNKQRSPF